MEAQEPIARVSDTWGGAPRHIVNRRAATARHKRIAADTPDVRLYIKRAIWIRGWCLHEVAKHLRWHPTHLRLRLGASWRSKHALRPQHIDMIGQLLRMPQEEIEHAHRLGAREQGWRV